MPETKTVAYPVFPQQVRLSGMTYGVVESEVLLDETVGVQSSKKLLIVIDKDLPTEAKASTLLHELLHALSDSLKLGLSENQVCRLEAGLFSLLRDNRDTLVPYLVSDHWEIVVDN